MATKLYQPTAEGGIKFKSERRAWEVRIPAWVYDLWMPLVGAEAIGVYSLYCRLEMNEGVRKITMRDIARAARIGDKRLNDINTMLQDCGFVTINKPGGAKRLMHWTTEIIVHDPPQDIAAVTISKYQHPQGYTPVSKWLVGDAPETLGSVSDDTDQRFRNPPCSVSNIGTLGLVETLETTTMQPEPTTDNRLPSTPGAASAAGGGDENQEPGTGNRQTRDRKTPKGKDTPAAAFLRGAVQLDAEKVIAELGALDLETVRSIWNTIKDQPAGPDILKGRLVNKLRAHIARQDNPDATPADPLADAKRRQEDHAMQVLMANLAKQGMTIGRA